MNLYFNQIHAPEEQQDEQPVRMSRRSSTLRYKGLNSVSVSHTSWRFMWERHILTAGKESERVSAAETKRQKIIKGAY